MNCCCLKERKKSWESFRICLIKSTANPAHFGLKLQVKSKVEISQNFVAFSNIRTLILLSCLLSLLNLVNIYFLPSKGWVLKSKVFGQKSTVVQWNYQILWAHSLTVCQKLGIILENEVIQKFEVIKKLFLQKCASKLAETKLSIINYHFF